MTPRRSGLLAWASAHGIEGAVLVWVATAVIGWVSARTTIPTFMSRGASGAIPVALLVPLLAAAAATFAAHHEAPQLTQTASRSLLWARTGWSLAVVVPGVLLAGVAAVHSNQVDIAAGVRNVLLLTALSYAASTWLPPGLALLPPFAYLIVCYAAAGFWTARSVSAPPWAALLNRQGTPEELIFAGGLTLAVVLASATWRDRAGT